MDTSIFMDLTKIPEISELAIALEDLFPVWMEIKDFVFLKYPSAVEEWHVSVKKYGWGFRIKDKKRAIIYLSPRKRYFKVAMVLGQKATDQILNSNISSVLKDELMNSKLYPEGRIIRIDVNDYTFINDIKKLVEIKIAN